MIRAYAWNGPFEEAIDLYVKEWCRDVSKQKQYYVANKHIISDFSYAVTHLVFDNEMNLDYDFFDFQKYKSRKVILFAAKRKR